MRALIKKIAKSYDVSIPITNITQLNQLSLIIRNGAIHVKDILPLRPEKDDWIDDFVELSKSIDRKLGEE